MPFHLSPQSSIAALHPPTSIAAPWRQSLSVGLWRQCQRSLWMVAHNCTWQQNDSKGKSSSCTSSSSCICISAAVAGTVDSRWDKEQSKPRENCERSHSEMNSIAVFPMAAALVGLSLIRLWSREATSSRRFWCSGTDNFPYIYIFFFLQEWMKRERRQLTSLGCNPFSICFWSNGKIGRKWSEIACHYRKKRWKEWHRIVANMGYPVPNT